MMAQERVIGLIAGSGDLPKQILSYCQQAKIPVHVIAFEGQTPNDTVEGISHLWLKLGTVAPLLEYFEKHQVTHVVMAGGIKRPSISELSLDWTGTKLLARVGLGSKGDDGVLSAITDYLQEQGFEILSAADLLPITAGAGMLTSGKYDAEFDEDIQRGLNILHVLGDQDVGQSIVIQQGLVLGIEAVEGTAELIHRCASYQRLGRKPILIKWSKTGQSRLVDLPTIGVDTIDQCVKAGFAGIVIEADVTQVLEKEAVINLANRAGLFIKVLGNPTSPLVGEIARSAREGDL